MESFPVGLDGLVTSFLPKIDKFPQSHKWIQETLYSATSSKSFLTGGSLNNLQLHFEPYEYVQVLPKASHPAKWVFQTTEQLLANSVKRLRGTSSDSFNVDNISISVVNSIVKFSVDGESNQVSVNNVRSLYFAAVIEEMNIEIGQEDLFLRSVRLIKVWFAIESRRLSHQDLTSVFTHDVIVVLVAYIFGSQSPSVAAIKQPYDALHTFLHVFGDEHFMWADFQITITSAENIKTGGTTSYASATKAPARIIAREQAASAAGEGGLGEGGKNKIRDAFTAICEKYAQRYHASNTLQQQPQLQSPGESLSSFGGVTECESLESFATPRVGVEHMTVTDPITRQNLINLSSNDCTLSVADISSVLLNAQLDLLIKGPMTKKPYTVESLFPFMHAAATHRARLTSDDSSSSERGGGTGMSKKHSLQEIIDSITSAEIILSNKLTPALLVRLVSEILNRHGPMPVDEIEKLVAAATGMTDLPRVLAVVFNGLQAFLSSHGTVFAVDSSADSNSFVCLASNSSNTPPQQQQQQMMGNGPHQALLQQNGFPIHMPPPSPHSHLQQPQQQGETRHQHSNSIGSADSSHSGFIRPPLVSANSIGSVGSTRSQGRSIYNVSPPSPAVTPGSINSNSGGFFRENQQQQQMQSEVDAYGGRGGNGYISRSPGLQVAPPQNGQRKPYYTDLDNRAAAAAVTNNGVYVPMQQSPPVPYAPPPLQPLGRPAHGPHYNRNLSIPMSAPPPERPRPYFENKRYIGKDTYAKNSRAAILAMQEKEAEKQQELLAEQAQRDQSNRWQPPAEQQQMNGAVRQPLPQLNSSPPLYGGPQQQLQQQQGHMNQQQQALAGHYQHN